MRWLEEDATTSLFSFAKLSKTTVKCPLVFLMPSQEKMKCYTATRIWGTGRPSPDLISEAPLLESSFFFLLLGKRG